MDPQLSRRGLLGAATGAALPAHAADEQALVEIDPAPKFDLSPYLYMQFMEPLGATDGSVEAAWDHDREDWREDLIAATQDLAPTMLRWGGIFTDYYRWLEGVGPRPQRKPMRNLLWGGIESNQVGTAEFVGLCRKVGAEPLICVNFESDGRRRFLEAGGSVRTADAREAADWVAYCNRPDHPERTAHGSPEPYAVRFWQIGNETAYDPNGFDLDTARRKTAEFARAMRRSDPGISIIAWGEGRRGKSPENWAKGMIEAAGEHLQYLAFHHMFNPDARPNPVLEFARFRQDPARTWAQLMQAWKIHDDKIRWMREQVQGYGVPLAMTECHYSIPGRNRCEVLSTWAAGVSYARLLNLHERHGDVLKIATAADFCGTRWQVNAVMIPMPRFRGEAFLMPVAHVMRLYRRHSGQSFVEVRRAPSDLDITASRTGDRIWLHVANTNRTLPVRAAVHISGRRILGGKVYEITADPMVEIDRSNAHLLRPKEKTLPAGGEWTFPPASVSAVECRTA